MRTHLGAVATAAHRAPASVLRLRVVEEDQRTIRCGTFLDPGHLVAPNEIDGIPGYDRESRLDRSIGQETQRGVCSKLRNRGRGGDDCIEAGDGGPRKRSSVANRVETAVDRRA